MTEQLNKQKVPLINQVNINVSQNIKHTDGHPADTKCCHHQAHQAEGLALTHALSLCLALSVVTRYNTVPQFDRDAQVRDAERRQRQDVGDKEGAVRVSQPLLLLAHPELLADGEALILKLHMVGVSNSWSHQTTGQQPDPREKVGARQDRDALFQRMDCGVVSIKERRGENSLFALPQIRSHVFI